MKRKSSTIAVSICMLILTIAMTTIYVASPNPTTVSIYPTTITGPPPGIGETFTIYIKIQDVTDLYLYVIVLSWNPTVLECLSWTYNKTFFTPDLTLPGTINNTLGRMDPPYAATLTDPPHTRGVSGSGTLADVKFRVLRGGQSWINFTACDVLDSSGIGISRELVNGTFSLTPPCGPTAVKTHTPTSPRINKNVTFDASASLPGFNGTDDVAIANYTWDFGDASPTVTETGSITTHNYTAVGTYTVNLTVMCVYDPVLVANGLTSDSTWQNITIRSREPNGPTAKFSYWPPEPLVNKTVEFDASASLPGFNGTDDVAIANYTWDFGDGSPIVTETNPITTHIYTKAGTYRVTLNVTDSERQWDTLSKNITVSAVHDVAIKSVTPSPSEVDIGESVSITVVVKNEGDFNETFEVTVYYDETAIIPWQTVTSLAPGAERTLNFTWDTTGVAARNYTIKAVAETVTGETETDDNTLINGTVTVKGVAKPKEGIPPWVWIVIAVAAIVVIVVVVYILMRRKPS